MEAEAVAAGPCKVETAALTPERADAVAGASTVTAARAANKTTAFVAESFIWEP
jgi:hypothetical protein